MCNERQGQPVGGPFGIKDASAEAQAMMAEARELIASAKVTVESVNRMMAKLEILVNKLVP